MSTVLIVEDDFAILFVAESTLRIEGYETVAAATRKEALAILSFRHAHPGAEQSTIRFPEKKITRLPQICRKTTRSRGGVLLDAPIAFRIAQARHFQESVPSVSRHEPVF